MELKGYKAFNGDLTNNYGDKFEEGKTYHLGTYSKIEDAVQARSRAEEKLFDAFLEEYYEANKNQTMKNTKKETLKNAPNRNTRLSAATPACVGSSSQAQVVLTE